MIALLSTSDDYPADRASHRNDMGGKEFVTNAALVDMEDPEFRGKSMAQVDKELWAKDAASLKAMGVNLANNHLDGYLVKAKREEEDQALKPWMPGSRLENMSLRPPRNTSVENWDNPEFKFEIENGVAYMTLNRPEANNALNDGIDVGLADACRILKNRPDIRVAVLTGNGRMFCAGGDPKSFQAAQGISYDAVDKNAPPPGFQIAMRAGMADQNMKGGNMAAKLWHTINTIPQYLIVCAQGSAMGGGVGIVCMSDMTIAVKTAQFALSEVKLGVIPATISPYVIARIGVTNCKRLFCTGEPFKAQRALEAGMVHQIVDTKDGFAPIIKEVCAKLQAVAPGTVKMCKEIMVKTYNAPMSTSLIEYTAEMYAKTRLGKEAEAGMAALQEKRKPVWMEDQIVPREA